MDELIEGERLLSLGGEAYVALIIRHHKVVDVFNIEVDGEHVYRILAEGLLVHNAEYPGLTRLYDALGTPIPFGFRNLDAFQGFVKKAYTKLGDDAEIVFQGSSVTGKSFKTGEVFDVGRVSDIDLGVSSSRLFREASNNPISRVKTEPDRIGPISAADLGLGGMLTELSNNLGRNVSIMLYPSLDQALRRPSLYVSR